MILSFEHVVTVFTDYGTNLAIVKQIKLATADTVKQNLKLVWASMYLSEFNLQIVHKPGKSHTVSDAFN